MTNPESFMLDLLGRAHRRLLKINIDITLSVNYPWVYLDTVNGKKVKVKKNANHGYCVAIVSMSKHHRGSVFIRDMFEQIRKEVENETKD